MKLFMSILFIISALNAIAVPSVKLPKSVTVLNNNGNTITYPLHKNLNLLRDNHLEIGLSVYSYTDGVYKGESSYLGTLATDFEYCILDSNTESCFLIKKGAGHVVGLSGQTSNQSIIVNGFHIKLFQNNSIIKIN